MKKMNNIEEIIHALEMGKPDYDGEDVNYDVATIENAIKYLKQYEMIMEILGDYESANYGIMVHNVAEFVTIQGKYFDKILNLFKG